MASESTSPQEAFATARDVTGDMTAEMPGPAKVTDASQVAEADMERAIVSAVTLGALDVARVLAEQLDQRQKARAGNVVRFDAAGRRR